MAVHASFLPIPFRFFPNVCLMRLDTLAHSKCIHMAANTLLRAAYLVCKLSIKHSAQQPIREAFFRRTATTPRSEANRASGMLDALRLRSDLAFRPFRASMPAAARSGASFLPAQTFIHATFVTRIPRDCLGVRQPPHATSPPNLRAGTRAGL
jgi:hypothetical protein